MERRQGPGLEGVVAELGAGKEQQGGPKQGVATAETGLEGAQQRALVATQEGAPELVVVQQMVVAELVASFWNVQRVEQKD